MLYDNVFVSVFPALQRCPLGCGTGGMMLLIHSSMANPSLWIYASLKKVSGPTNYVAKLVTVLHTKLTLCNRVNTEFHG